MRLLPLFLLAFLTACTPEAPPPGALAVNLTAEDHAFLDDLQRRTFDWFWETTDHETGLVPDRWPTRSFSSVASIGFGLTTYAIGAERGYVERGLAAERTLNTLRFLYNLPQGPEQRGTAGHRGFFYHFLEYETGHRYGSVELSSIDTALLLAGALFSQQYFNGSDPAEVAIRAYTDSLYHRVEWDWMQPRSPLISMGWHPESGFIPHDYYGYNEAMVLYLLAMGSPTFPAHADTWKAFKETYQWQTFYGQEHYNFSPLFGHQYSHVWIDFRGIQDDSTRARGIDYFENSRRAALAQHAYAVENPNGWAGYGELMWGLSACDGPADVRRMFNGTERQFQTYSARGASAIYVGDDGTLTPTAVGGSLPFVPELAVATLRNMASVYGDDLYTRYGFLDAINPSFTFEDVRLQHGTLVPGKGWIADDHLGIDQGPILIMAENLRTELVWRYMQNSPYLAEGLRKAGFSGGWLDRARTRMPAPVIASRQDGTDDMEANTERFLVVIGSSTAEGAGASHADSSWVGRLASYVRTNHPDVAVLNLAKGGYTTYHLMPGNFRAPEGRPIPDNFRNISRALRGNPLAVLINLPSNDRASGYTVEEQMSNYRAMVALLEERGIPYRITTPGPRDLDEAGLRDQRRLKQELEAAFPGKILDFWTDIVLPDGRINPRYDSGDRLHVNDAAHAVYARRVIANSLLSELGLN